MAHQDYVSRARPTRKKSKKAQRQSISFKTKFFGLITLITLAAFAYFLWSIKDNKPLPLEQAKPISKKVTDSKKQTLPELPQEKWSYRKELAQKEVEQSNYEVTDQGPWKMQCASFRSDAQAQALKAKIAFLGIESQVVKSQGKNGVWYKVVLGPYQRKRNAEKDKHKLRKNDVLTCQIWLWR